jgi:hypothetical protein
MMTLFQPTVMNDGQLDAAMTEMNAEMATFAAFHRDYREGAVTLKSCRALLEQFAADDHAGAFRWLPSGPTSCSGSATSMPTRLLSRPTGRPMRYAWQRPPAMAIGPSIQMTPTC